MRLEQTQDITGAKDYIGYDKNNHIIYQYNAYLKQEYIFN